MISNLNRRRSLSEGWAHVLFNMLNRRNHVHTKLRRAVLGARTEMLENRLLFTIPGTQLDIWHTYTQATNDLNTIHNAYPTLTRLISIGKTQQNRDMWAME